MEHSARSLELATTAMRPGPQRSGGFRRIAPRTLTTSIVTAIRVLKRIKFRMHFMGSLAEPFWNSGTEAAPQWIPDWRYEIALLDFILHGTRVAEPNSLTDTLPRQAVQTLDVARIADAYTAAAAVDGFDCAATPQQREHHLRWMNAALSGAASQSSTRPSRPSSPGFPPEFQEQGGVAAPSNLQRTPTNIPEGKTTPWNAP